MNKLNVLCLHGIGGKDNPGSRKDWKQEWKAAIERKVTNTNISFPVFDHYFEKQEATITDYWKFLKDVFLYESNRMKGVESFKDDYLDMVVEFFRYPELRMKLREFLKKEIQNTGCHVIYAHSLGSLICYDLFLSENNGQIYKDITLITAGSQLGIQRLPDFIPVQKLNLKRWYNFNNPYDRVFAGSMIRLNADNFSNERVAFREGLASHNALQYIEKSDQKIWTDIISSYEKAFL